MVRQTEENLCGIAALQMIESFYQRPIQPPHYENLISYVKANNGTSGLSLKQAFVDSSYDAVLFPGELNHNIIGLLHHLDAEHPLIVMIGPELKRHYLVAFGYDPGTRHIFFNDPLNGAIVFSYESFLKFWKTAHYFTLLAVPKP